jgi:[FeFe] hydrogenase H-cluster maturation GTPase HydF
VRKAKQVLNKTDVAVLVVDARDKTLGGADGELLALFREKGVPCVVARNKSDLLEGPVVTEPVIGGGSLPPAPAPQSSAVPSFAEMYVSAKTGSGVNELKECIASLAKTEEPKLRIVADLVRPGDFVVLVTPIDSAAPKGRLILPQQQTIRDVLEADAAAIVVKEFELKETLERLGVKPALVITDSQAFAKVSADTPPDIPLTSFSILFARFKGFLLPAVRGVKSLDSAGDGDRILVCEGCTHHRQCDDIGTVKLPRWIKQYTGKNPEFVFSSGGGFPGDLSSYKLVVHCGACMLNEREMRYRQKCAEDQDVPFTNYGIAIAFMQGILKRSLRVFPRMLAELEGPES